MTREEFITSKESVVAGIQLKLLNTIEGFMQKNNLNRNELAQKLEVTKGYISQLFNVSFDHKISKLVDLALSCNAMPLIFFVNLDEFVKNDANDKIYDLVLVDGPQTVNYENNPAFSSAVKIEDESTVNMPEPKEWQGNYKVEETTIM